MSGSDMCLSVYMRLGECMGVTDSYYECEWVCVSVCPSVCVSV